MWRLIENKDWDFIRNQFDWIQDMEGIPQDKIFHQEGDVAVHTQMVMEAMLNLEEYQSQTEQNQEILFASTLMHDVEKRSTTVLEKDGRITSKGHAKKGAYTSRALLYKNFDTPFEIKEQIAKLVQFHMIPFWIFEKPNPLKTLFQLSLEVDTALLYLLAKADLIGRICPDHERMFYQLELFKEYCLEYDCFGKAKAFGSDFGRYDYFAKENGSPDYVPFEKDSFEVIMMSGLPGSGKDFFIKKNYRNWPVVSIDDLRRKHKVTYKDKKGNGQMIQLAKETAKEYLRKRQPFIWNATNITQNMRSQLIDLFQTYGAKTKIIYLEVPIKKLMHQNRDRDFSIPVSAIEKMIKKLEPPVLWEAPIVEYFIK